ncbi:hypothetical protein WR25_06006 [Diploscapter pachys]|uniref:N-acetyltransferase domain-containing protein n=1 Tax=Diploscapter pachys TaxID=2018661 RepID=A0A2A2LQJ8_9BILA|nr:hypothetical protein WR25_06006 [Diploscapter pachys]
MSAPAWEMLDDIPSNSPIWKQWQKLVNDENWTSDCSATTGLTPTLSTTRSVWAVDKKDSSYIGCVVWNEYDSIALIGFYLLTPAYRKLGIGSKLWKRAIERIPKDYTIALRSVPVMIPRYSSQTTPVRGPTLHYCTVKASEAVELCNKLLPADFESGYSTKKLEELSHEEWEEFLKFDRKITGKDRREWLTAYRSHEHKFAIVVFSKNDHSIVCYASTVMTSHLHQHRYKIAPIYAIDDSLGVFSLRILANWIGSQYPDATIYCHLMEGTRGFEFLKPKLEQITSVTISGTSLFSKPYNNPLDLSKVYFPNNSSGHYDI